MDDSFVSKDEIKSVCSLPLKVVDGSLIDFETTGIPGQHSSHEVLTLGYLQGDKLAVIQRKVREKMPFYNEIRKILEMLPRPFYSYNTAFERDVMQIELGLDVSDADFVDLMLPWRHKAEAHEMKWPSLNELISEPEDYFEEGKVIGANVPTLWDYYLTGAENEGILKLIMEHCFSDVLREATLLLRYPHHFK